MVRGLLSSSDWVCSVTTVTPRAVPSSRVPEHARRRLALYTRECQRSRAEGAECARVASDAPRPRRPGLHPGDLRSSAPRPSAPDPPRAGDPTRARRVRNRGDRTVTIRTQGESRLLPCRDDAGSAPVPTTFRSRHLPKERLRTGATAAERTGEPRPEPAAGAERNRHATPRRRRTGRDRQIGRAHV